MPMIVGRKYRRKGSVSAGDNGEPVANIDEILATSPTPENVEWGISPEELIGTVPDAGETITHGTLSKLNADYEWQERLVFLSTRQLCLAKRGEGCLKDSVPLNEIQRVAIRTDLLGADPASVDPEQNTDVLRTDKSQWHRIHGSGEEEHTFEVQTMEDGYNSGRPYYFKADGQEEAQKWVEQIKKAVKAEKERVLSESSGILERYRTKARKFYYSSIIQTLVAVLIFLNFIANVAQSEIQAEVGTRTYRTFEILDYVFTALFTVELVVNLFANWLWPFWNDGWSVFDFFVVFVSLIALGVEDVPGVSVLRLMRAFRVLRLFGRLSSLRQIINALTAALLPVLNAFLIMGLVTAIYAILGVSFYKEVSPQLFGSFFRALFTMFQVCTGDGWADQVARPLFEDDTGHIHPGVAIFFVSFHVIVSWTLLQVVVAVMLDNFTAAAENEKERMRKEKAERQGKTVAMNVLDPLLAALAHFNTSADLTARIHTLFQVLDVDESQTLSFKEIREGLRKLRVKPVIQLSQEDFDEMTNSGAMCTRDGELGKAEFERVIRSELKQYVQRQMANSMAMAAQDGSYTGTVLFVLKLLTIDMDDLCEIEMASGAEGEGGVDEDEGGAESTAAAAGVLRDSILKKARGRHGEGGGANRVCGRCGRGDGEGVEGGLEAVERSIAQLQEGFARQQAALDLILQRLEPGESGGGGGGGAAEEEAGGGAGLMAVLGGLLSPHRQEKGEVGGGGEAVRDSSMGPTPREPEVEGALSVSASLRRKLSKRARPEGGASLSADGAKGAEEGGGRGGGASRERAEGRRRSQERSVLFSPFARSRRSSGSASDDASMVV